MEIALVRVGDNADERIFRYLLSFVQGEKRERICRQRVKQNANHMLVGEILARLMIEKRFGVAFPKQQFARLEHGKPFLLGCPNVHFSISHSSEYVVCCVSNCPVGVDIQKIGGFDPDLAHSVCCEKELKQIEDNADSASEFTRLWTRKEAVLKRSGVGLETDNIKSCLDNSIVQSQRLDNYWLSVSG